MGKRIASVALVTAALIGTVAGGVSAAAKEKVTTTLKITVAQADIDSADPAVFDLNGKTKVSPKSDGAQKCLSKRKVEAFRVEAGSDRSLGTTKTNKRGKWYLRGEVPGSTSNGVYYAKVSKDTRGDYTCKADRSDDFVIDFDPS